MERTIKNLALKHNISPSLTLKILQKFFPKILDLSLEINSEDDYVLYDSLIGQVLSSLKELSSNAVNSSEEEVSEKDLLSRDYIIFTHMILRKPSTWPILYKVVEMIENHGSHSTLIVLSEVIDKVKEASEKAPKLKPLADSLELLKEFSQFKVLPGKISQENTILSQFIRHQPIGTSILVLGTNRGLTPFIQHWNSTHQTVPKYIKIFERNIIKGGELVTAQSDNSILAEQEDKKKAPYSNDPRKLLGGIPSEYERVYYTTKKGKRELLLEKRMSFGGEGNIYATNIPNKVAKIYHSSNNTILKIEKTKLLISYFKKLKNDDISIMERIAWPEKLLYNLQGEEVGYLMTYFENMEVLASYMGGQMKSLIPEINKSHQLIMALTLTEIFDFMHSHNIILGDINDMNVMYDQNLMAHLVDLDSIQLADQNYYYPVTVGRPEFLSPEHIYDLNFSFKRKKADDVWILQNLIFRLLTADADPFATSYDFKDERDIIGKGYYPYHDETHEAEEGIKNTIFDISVSYLPNYLKNLFWNSFNGRGKYFREEQRPSATTWLNQIVRYQNDLSDLIKKDPANGEYTPTVYKT